MLPPLPLEAWRETKDTLHLYLQILGKVRLALAPRANHWWHVTLRVSARGLTTRLVPYGEGGFEIELDLVDHALTVATSAGARRSFPLVDGLSVAEFHARVRAALSDLGVEVAIRAVPYDVAGAPPFASDTRHASWEREPVERFHRVLVFVHGVLEEFRGRFTGKSTPVHLFWHSFDLALTRFSGRPAPPRPDAGRVEREAYSHEVISFGFWAGDARVPEPAFYSYAAPEPPGLAGEPLSPAAASWTRSGAGAMALLRYEDVRRAPSPRETLLEFLESAYDAGARRAGWDREGFRLGPPGL